MKKVVSLLLVFLLVLTLGSTALAGRHHGAGSASRGQARQAATPGATCPNWEACPPQGACQAPNSKCPNGGLCGTDGTTCPYGYDRPLDGTGRQGGRCAK